MVHPDSTALEDASTHADVVVIAVGRARFLKGDMVKQGATVIDVGTNRIQNILEGAVDRLTVEPVAGALTPVPGGVGPMTVAMLMINVIKAYVQQRSEKSGSTAHGS